MYRRREKERQNQQGRRRVTVGQKGFEKLTQRVRNSYTDSRRQIHRYNHIKILLKEIDGTIQYRPKC